MTNRTTQHRGTRLSCYSLAVCACLLVAAVNADPPPPSTYAPAEDIAGQIEMYIEQVDEDLAAEAEYGDEQQDRVLKAANTLIVLAQVLAKHDEEHPLKKAAPALFQAAHQLAESSDYATASAAQAAVKKALDSSSDADVDWTPAANLSELMKQVPIVNNRLRSGVNGTRFERLVNQNAGHATTLAAIAEASLHDEAYSSDEQWVAICAKMRDAAAEVRTAVRAKDQDKAKAGLARLVTTCDECHHVFRD